MKKLYANWIMPVVVTIPLLFIVAMAIIVNGLLAQPSKKQK